MERVIIAPRPDWQAKVEQLGFDWHTPEGQTYWDETAYWKLSPTEIEALRAAGNEAQALLLDTVNQIIVGNELPLYGFDGALAELIEKSWEERGSEPTLMGRFDFGFDGVQPRLLDYNGETPSSLFETSMVQRQWLQEALPGSTQFNTLNEHLGVVFRKLAAAQRATIRYDGDPDPVVHFTTMTPNPETEGNARYLLNLAQASGLIAEFVALTDIGWHSDGYFCDSQNQEIDTLLKLWPLAWLLEDEFGQKLAGEALDGNITLVEPTWKLLAQNKRVLAAMWDRNAYHPMLLNTSPINSPVLAGTTGIVRKPINGVDGQNIRVLNLDNTVADETGGNYEADQFIFQERANLAQADGHFAVCNVWVVGGEACALGIREADTVIGDIAARFVPHAIG